MVAPHRQLSDQAQQGAENLDPHRLARTEPSVHESGEQAAEHGGDRKQYPVGQHLQGRPMHDARCIDAADGQQRGHSVGVEHARPQKDGGVALGPEALHRLHQTGETPAKSGEGG